MNESLYLGKNDLFFLKSIVNVYDNYNSKKSTLKEFEELLEKSKHRLKKVSHGELDTILHNISKTCFSFTDRTLYYAITGGTLTEDMKKLSDIFHFFVVSQKNLTIKQTIQSVVMLTGERCVDALNSKGLSPYKYALANDNKQNQELLIELGANVEI
jgi:hypothetical protein